MKRKNKTYIVIGVIISGLILSSYIYEKITEPFPSKRPTANIKYQGNKLYTKSGDENWFNSKFGGNSVMRGNPYEIGKEMDTFYANPGDTIEFSFSLKPEEVYIVNWENKPRKDCDQKNLGSSNKYSIELPSEKGEYIIEIYGLWDSAHTSSNIFKVNIQ